MGGQFWSVYVPASLAGDSAVTAVFEQVDIVHRMIAAYPGRFQLALTADDVDDGVQGRQDRLPARRGGRPQHQRLARRAPLAVRPRRPLHDADAQRQRRLGRLGDRRAGLRRPVRLRAGGRGGDAAPRHARRPVARGGFHYERRPRRRAGTGDLLSLQCPGAHRSPAQRPRRRSRPAGRERRRVHGGLRPVLRLAGVHRLVLRAQGVRDRPRPRPRQPGRGVRPDPRVGAGPPDAGCHHHPGGRPHRPRPRGGGPRSRGHRRRLRRQPELPGGPAGRLPLPGALPRAAAPPLVGVRPEVPGGRQHPPHPPRRGIPRRPHGGPGLTEAEFAPSTPMRMPHEVASCPPGVAAEPLPGR